MIDPKGQFAAELNEIKQWHDAFPKVGFLGVWAFIAIGCWKEALFFGLAFVHSCEHIMISLGTTQEKFIAVQKPCK